MTKAEFFEGYYKGEFVHIPKKGSSKSEVAKVRDYLENNGDERITKVLEPETMSHSELKKFCEDNNLPLSWVVDNKVADTPAKLRTRPLRNALDIFLHSTRANTEKSYRYAIDTLGDLGGLLDPDQSVVDFLSKESEILNILRNEGGTADHEMGFIQAFFKFLKNGNKKIRRRGDNDRLTRRPNPKNSPLTQIEFDQFILELEKINSQDALIARTLWYMNKELLSTGDHITLESLLRATQNDLHPKSKIIDFWRYNNNLSHLTSISMPDELFDEILNISENRPLFIFSKRDGGSLKPEQVLKSFKIAGERAGINRTINLRPLPESARKKLDKL